jgi:hypothetical protein
MASRTTIRTTTETLLILGSSGIPVCPVCGGVMVTLEQGRMLCGMSSERLNRWLESGAVHHSGRVGLPQMVCLHSLLICLRNNTSA